MWDQHFVAAGSCSELVTLNASLLAPAPRHGGPGDRGGAAAGRGHRVSGARRARPPKRGPAAGHRRLRGRRRADCTAGRPPRTARHRHRAQRRGSYDPTTAGLRSCPDCRTTDPGPRLRRGGAHRRLGERDRRGPRRRSVRKCSDRRSAGPTARDRTHVHYVTADAATLGLMSQRVDRGVLALPEAETMTLADAAESHRRQERGGVRGRLLLAPRVP
jgi:hypothetical protein